VERWLALCLNLVVLDMRECFMWLEEEEHSLSTGEMESILGSMLNEAGLPSLRRLQHCGFPPFSWSHNVVSAGVRVLTAYSSQLLTLDLRCQVEGKEDGDELMAAVLLCSQLTSLTLGRWWSSSTVVVSGPSRLPNLIALSIDFPRMDHVPHEAVPLTEAQLASTLDHCPHLQSLVLRSLHSTPLDVLLWIDQRCPDLRLLHFVRLFELISHSEKPARWAAATTIGAVAFPSLVSLTMTSGNSYLCCSTVIRLTSLLRLAPRLRFLHLDLERLAHRHLAAFAALPALRGLRLGQQNDGRMKEGERLRRCWRKVGSDRDGLAAQYSQVSRSPTRVWSSPHLRPGWIGCRHPITRIDDHDLVLTSAPLTNQEIENVLWPWGEHDSDVLVESVDGMTGREALLAALAPAPRSESNTGRASGQRKRRRAA
jgi:hypothetical protein